MHRRTAVLLVAATAVLPMTLTVGPSAGASATKPKPKPLVCSAIKGTAVTTPGALTLTAKLSGCVRTLTGGGGTIAVSGGSGTITWKNAETTSGHMTLVLVSTNACTTGTEYALKTHGVSSTGVAAKIKGVFTNDLCIVAGPPTTVALLDSTFKL